MFLVRFPQNWGLGGGSPGSQKNKPDKVHYPKANRTSVSNSYQPEQGNLFTAKDLAGTYSTHQAASHKTIDQDPIALTQWKQRIHTYQQSLEDSPTEQPQLFALTPPTNTLPNPFHLPRQNTQFWRWKASDAGVSALYFVIDYETQILLYVGETIQSESRWRGTHDCKRYLLHYQQAHYSLDLPTQLGIAFWKDAPSHTHNRQRLESELIHQWRSPFNKENWTFWGTPFVQAD